MHQNHHRILRTGESEETGTLPANDAMYGAGLGIFVLSAAVAILYLAVW